MTEAVEQIDTQAAMRYLREITRGWDDLGEPAVIELRCLMPGRTPDWRRFQPTESGLADLISHADAMNRVGLNTYVVVNPVRPFEGSRAAKDEDVIASCFFWADGDDEEAANSIRNFAGPKYTMAVTTGRIPSPRPHVYWRIEDGPIRNLTAWTGIQRAIAARLSTDPSVVNPSRIMRLPGFVNWPTEKKKAKGRVAEVATFRTDYDDDREPVPFEQMRRAFGTVENPAAPAISTGDFRIDTGRDAKSVDDYLDMLTRAETDGFKHTGVRDIAASLAGQGAARAFTEAFIRKVCPVWDENAANLVDTAYAKFYRPQEPEYRQSFDFDAESAPEAGGWNVQTAADFTADFVAPEYIVDGIIQRGRLYTLTAPTGSGKTGVMLYMATALATGGQFCGKDVEPGDVLFMAGENPDDVRARVIATMEFYGIDPKSCRLHFIPGTFSIRRDMERLREEAAKLPNLMMVVVDTFAAYFDGDDENSNAQALNFAKLVRSITAFPSKPSVVMPAHPVKNATRGNLSPKGGSSLLNEVDGNLTLWKDGDAISMHWQGKFRGADFEPLTLELERYESDRLKDSKGRQIPTVLAKPVLTLRAQQIARENLSVEDNMLLSVADGPALSLAQRAEACGLAHKQVAKRVLEKLAGQKLVRRFRTNWELTKDGERAVEMIQEGGNFAVEFDD